MGNKKMNCFKIYIHDIGLLISMNEYGIGNSIINDSVYANNGGIIENLFGICLKNNGFDIFYFQKKSGLEIDFIINLNGFCAAIEVKSGNNKLSKSLISIIDNYKSVQRYLKFESIDVPHITSDKIEHLPLYFINFLKLV
jgi:predicted AAA+ superfamily ATPase